MGSIAILSPSLQHLHILHSQGASRVLDLGERRGMRVHPVRSAAATGGRRKHLRRLPHIFSKVLELPLAADADVAVHEDPEGFRFVVAAAAVGLDGGVRAHAIRIHPGVIKVVIRPPAAAAEEVLDDLELDRWRFRLPPSTRPALAAASYDGGELVVTVPKGSGSEESDIDEDGGGGEEREGWWGDEDEERGIGCNRGTHQLVIVQ
ncbi:uncharacterized protein LOC109720938 isoform X2 [Ananas comosus]|uniref:Uncharacterized protein LOC109720938 isoform X2 n=1 Tax=Ananas comosus TaxID=4615 RepID=A0A6P5G5M2_ANACO|nr:uncharacterized protein LOC109720938 isoform X2 [Ananas comosus]